MAQSQNKTRKTDTDVREYLASVVPDRRREDGFRLLEIMEEITGEPAKMWGNSLIGFGEYHYRYESGREGDMLKVGFSPRKTSLSIYIMPGFDRYEGLMQQLGKHKTGKACLYINKLADVDEAVLRQLIDAAYRYMTEKYG